MKERLEATEKGLLLLIPYLIVLSLAYYWGYWGYFDIDAVSYYGVQDLIKGFAYTLPAVLTVGVAILVGSQTLDFYLTVLQKRFNKPVARVLYAIPFIAFILLVFSDIISDSAGDWVGPVVVTVIVLGLSEVLLNVIGGYWAWAIANAVSFFFVKWLVVFSIVSFVSSYSYGRNEARSISKNRRFPYAQLALSLDSVKEMRPFKYLGKAGDYYFFISCDNTEKRIVSAQTIPTLVLHQYDRNDSASTRAYRALEHRGKPLPKVLPPTKSPVPPSAAQPR